MEYTMPQFEERAPSSSKENEIIPKGNIHSEAIFYREETCWKFYPLETSN